MKKVATVGILLLVICAIVQSQNSARFLTYFNCCKPTCAFALGSLLRTPVKSCAKDGLTSLPANTSSGCSGGSAYLCTGQQPFVGKNNVAYAWASATLKTSGPDLCCNCYELTFTDRSSNTLKGQKMIVQVTDFTSGTGNVFNVQIPSTGDGRQQGGCASQFGATVKTVANSVGDCGSLPTALQPGCKFRFGWLKNVGFDIVNYKPVTCPPEITSQSGCVKK